MSMKQCIKHKTGPDQYIQVLANIKLVHFNRSILIGLLLTVLN